MKKGTCGVLGMAVLLGAQFAPGIAKEAAAGVGVGININLGPPPVVIAQPPPMAVYAPPPVVIAEPPEMVYMPSSQVYFAPNLEFDVFFYGGYWWSPRGDRWYRARAYNGPWGAVKRRYVPAPVCRVPSDYRVVYEQEEHIPYGQWKKQWEHHGRGHHHRHDHHEDDD